MQTTLIPYLRAEYKKVARKRAEELWPQLEDMVRSLYNDLSQNFMGSVLDKMKPGRRTLELAEGIINANEYFVRSAGHLGASSLSNEPPVSRDLDDFKFIGIDPADLDSYLEQTKNLLLEPGLFLLDLSKMEYPQLSKVDCIFEENKLLLSNLLRCTLPNGKILAKFNKLSEEEPTYSKRQKTTKFAMRPHILRKILKATKSSTPVSMMIASKKDNSLYTIKDTIIHKLSESGWTNTEEMFYINAKDVVYPKAKAPEIHEELVDIPVYATWTLDAYNDDNIHKINLGVSYKLDLCNRISALNQTISEKVRETKNRFVRGAINYVLTKNPDLLDSEFDQVLLESSLQALNQKSNYSAIYDDIRKELLRIWRERRQIKKAKAILPDLEDRLESLEQSISKYSAPNTTRVKRKVWKPKQLTS